MLIGGHLKPDPLSRAASVLKTHGKAVAEHVASFEARQVSEIRELIEREDVDCDFEETRVTDVCLYRAGRDKIKADIARVAAAGISTVSGIKYSTDAEAEQVCQSCIVLSGVRIILMVDVDLWCSGSVVVPHVPCRSIMAIPTRSPLTQQSNIEWD